MRRLQLTLLCLTAILAVTFAAGCAKTGNKTTKKGAGGLPIQQFDPTGQTIAWEIPKDLEYPNMKRMYENNNRIWLVADTVESVATHYMAKLPEAIREDINGKRHVKVRNQEIEIDIESGGTNTKLVFSPIALLKPK